MVKAVAELSSTAMLMSVPSALMLSRAMSPTLVIAASLKLVAPSVLAEAVDTIPALKVCAVENVCAKPRLARVSFPVAAGKVRVRSAEIDPGAMV